MAKYRIVRYQRIIKNKRTGEIIEERPPVYNVEYKNIFTILFGPGGDVWDTLFYEDFKSYEEAESALMKILNKKNEKEVITKKVISKF